MDVMVVVHTIIVVVQRIIRMEVMEVMDVVVVHRVNRIVMDVMDVVVHRINSYRINGCDGGCTQDQFVLMDVMSY